MCVCASARACVFVFLHQVTDMCSFYHLPSTVIGHAKHRTLNAAYSFYNVATTVREREGERMKERRTDKRKMWWFSHRKHTPSSSLPDAGKKGLRAFFTRRSFTAAPPLRRREETGV